MKDSTPPESAEQKVEGKEKRPDRFWERFPIPFQEEDPDFPFANAVVVSQYFIRVQGDMAPLLGYSEKLSEKLSELADEKEELEVEYLALKRNLLAANYSTAPKSGSILVLEAYVRKVATDEQRRELDLLETRMRELVREMATLKRYLSKSQGRVKALEKRMEYAEQYVNMEKAQMKLRGE